MYCDLIKIKKESVLQFLLMSSIILRFYVISLLEVGCYKSTMEILEQAVIFAQSFQQWY